MNMTDVATWGQLISSAAVLVTLVYLSIQTRQTSTLLRSESRQSMIDTDLQLLFKMLDNPDIRSNFASGQDMTEADKLRLNDFLLAFCRTREHHWLQYKAGALDKATWEIYQKAISDVLGTERTRNWWHIMGRQFFESAFVETVDALIEGQPNIGLQQQLLAWK